jgi:hypothetical protein
MRVDYVLPALQPDVLSDLPTVQGPKVAFRDQLKNTVVELPTAWQTELGLDAVPEGGNHIGPPPRSNTLELGDMETQRLRYRNLLTQHSAKLLSPDKADLPAEWQPVQVMLKMLTDMQAMEDEVTSRNVALTRG